MVEKPAVLLAWRELRSECPLQLKQKVKKKGLERRRVQASVIRSAADSDNAQTSVKKRGKGPARKEQKRRLRSCGGPNPNVATTQGWENLPVPVTKDSIGLEEAHKRVRGKRKRGASRWKKNRGHGKGSVKLCFLEKRKGNRGQSTKNKRKPRWHAHCFRGKPVRKRKASRSSAKTGGTGKCPRGRGERGK